MPRLSTTQHADFVRVRALCRAGMDSASLRGALGGALSSIVGADAWCFMELEPELLLPIHSVSSGWTEDAHRLLLDHVILVSPVADLARFYASGRRTVQVDEVSTGVRSDPYFAHHLLPFGYRHELLTMCSLRGRPIALLTLTRNPRTGPFAGWHVRLLDALAPHVAGAMLAAVRAEADLAVAGDAHTVVFGASGAVEWADPGGEAWIRATGECSARRDMALGTVRNLVAAEGAGARAMTVRDLRTGVLHRVSGQRQEGPDGACRTVVRMEPVQHPEAPPCLVRLGLTARQAEVACGVLRGEDTATIARALGCREATVRVHLHHVFARMDVSSRAELGALLMQRVPAVGWGRSSA